MKATILTILAMAVFWQLVSTLGNENIFPSLFTIAEELTRCYDVLLIHALHSIGRVAGGMFFGVLVGVPVGILLGYYKNLNKMISPTLYILGPIPKIALLPIIMLLFGIGEASKIFIIFIIMVFQIILCVRDSVQNIPPEYFVPFYTVKAKTRYIVKDILIPASCNELFTSLRIGLGTAISVLFFTETFGTRYGLGHFIMDSWLRVNYAQMYIGIVCLGLIGLLLTAGLDRLDRRIRKWI